MDHRAREGDNAVVDRRNHPGSAHLRRRHDGTPDHPCRGDLEDARLQPAKAPPDRAEVAAWGNLGGRSSRGPAGAHPRYRHPLRHWCSDRSDLVLVHVLQGCTSYEVRPAFAAGSAANLAARWMSFATREMGIRPQPRPGGVAYLCTPLTLEMRQIVPLASSDTRSAPSLSQRRRPADPIPCCR